jgi:hypothetical protein
VDFNDIDGINEMMESFMADLNDSVNYLRDKEISSPEEAVANATIVSTIQRLEQSMTMASEMIHLMAMMLVLSSPTDTLSHFIEEISKDDDYVGVMNTILAMIAHYIPKED